MTKNDDINEHGGVGSEPYGPPCPSTMTFDEWLLYGMENNYCGPPICLTHDGEPLTEAELDEFSEGLDPCLHVIRPYHDVAERLMVEAAHAPSVWRRGGWL